MRKTQAFTAALAVPALLAFTGTPVEKIAFTPAEGATVTKTFTTTTTTDLDEMSALMNGQPAPIPEMEMSMLMTQVVTITDEYGTLADGQPAKLTRTYDAIGTELEMEVDAGMGGAQTPSGTGTSELEGYTVVFSWDETTGEYKTAFAEGEDGDPDLLEGLTENMDLRGLLPQEELEVGGTYDIDVASLVEVLGAGGDLHLDIEMEGNDGPSMGPDPAQMTDFRRFFEDLLEGEATGKFTGVRDIEGAKVAVIELTIEVAGSADMADMAEGMMGGEEMPEGLEMSIDRMDVAMVYEGGGELLWNLKAGVIYGLDLNGDIGIDMEMEMAMDFGGQAMDMAMEMSMSGEVTSQVSTE